MAVILEARIDAIVCPSSICMERHARFAADAMAERVSSLADGDLFRAMGGKDENARCAQVCLGIAPGIAEFSCRPV